MRINTTTRYVVQAALAVALTLTFSGQAWSWPGGEGGGTSGGGGGTSGSSGTGGDSGGGAGGSSGGSDLAVDGGRLQYPVARKGTFNLTPNQEYALEMFNKCRASKDVSLQQLKFDGSFSFGSELGLDAQDTIQCMSLRGFTFNNQAVGRTVAGGGTVAPVAAVAQK